MVRVMGAADKPRLDWNDPFAVRGWVSVLLPDGTSFRLYRGDVIRTREP
jgi:hypothetical protein